MVQSIAKPIPPPNTSGHFTSSESKAALDAQALDTLLDIGGAELRVALGTQLTADFSRLREAINVEETDRLARAAHELKGLAATVGATRLSDMAHSLNMTADTLPKQAQAILVAAVQKEIDRVLAAVSKATQGSSQA